MRASGMIGLVALLGLAAAAPAPRHVRRAPLPSGTVVLSARPGSAEDQTARALTARDVAASARRREPPLVLVGSARLAGRHAPAALFVQLQSADLCGSAGCSTSVYVNAPGGWRRVLDSVSGPIRVAPEQHQGMADLLVDGDDRWVWNGTAYADTVSAPALDLRKSVEQHRKEVARHHK